jgi:hypothetical protein
MGRPYKQDKNDIGKVRRLFAENYDVVGTSKTQEDLPIYRDPLFQLVGASVIFVCAFAASLIVSGDFETLSQSVVIASGFLGMVVLLRSVRHGWNVSIYGRAREANWREATLRMEREMLRDASIRCARLLDTGTDGSAIDLLQSLTEETQRNLERVSSAASVTVVEQAEDRFLVLCMSGYMAKRPYYAEVGKSCAADQPFPVLLRTFAPDGHIVSDEVCSGERRFWVGVVSKDPDAKLDQGSARTIAAWVRLTDAMGLLPHLQRHLRRVS